MTAEGQPVIRKLTPGPAGDAPPAADPPAGRKRGKVGAVVGDRGYDSGANVRLVRRLRARVVLPPVDRRTHRRRYSTTVYQGRDVGERFWQKAKQSRRVATRYDKLDVGYLAFAYLASVLMVLRNP